MADLFYLGRGRAWHHTICKISLKNPEDSINVAHKILPAVVPRRREPFLGSVYVILLSESAFD